MPVTVREDVNVYEYAWFNGFFRYVSQKPGILHMYVHIGMSRIDIWGCVFEIDYNVLYIGFLIF